MIAGTLFSVCMFLFVVVALQWLHIRDKRRDHLNFEQNTIEILHKVHTKKFMAERLVDDLMADQAGHLEQIEALREALITQTKAVNEANENYRALEVGMDELQESLEQEILSYHDQLEAKHNSVIFYQHLSNDLMDIATYHEAHCLPIYQHV